MNGFEKIFLDVANKKIDKYADDVLKVLRNEVHVKSGALHDAIEKKKIADGHYFVGVNGSKLASDPRNPSKKNYAIPYYRGHKAYRITARQGKVLSWIDSRSGERRFAKYVNIPASSGDKFVDRAILRRPRMK